MDNSILIEVLIAFAGVIVTLILGALGLSWRLSSFQSEIKHNTDTIRNVQEDVKETRAEVSKAKEHCDTRFEKVYDKIDVVQGRVTEVAEDTAKLKGKAGINGS